MVPLQKNGGGAIFRYKGDNPTFDLYLGIEKYKNLPAAANIAASLEIYKVYDAFNSNKERCYSNVYIKDKNYINFVLKQDKYTMDPR